MQSREFRRPTFLKPEINTGSIEITTPTGEVAKTLPYGVYTLVRNMGSLSPELKKMIQPGFVIKQYTAEEHEESKWRNLFQEDLRALSSASLVEKAEKLKQRYEKIKDSFKELPDLIVPTQFIVGAEENKQDSSCDGKKYIYEMQPKINGLELESEYNYRVSAYIVMLMRTYMMQTRPEFPITDDVIQEISTWALRINHAFPNKQKQLAAELQKFIEIARTLPPKLHMVPFDCVWPNNVKFTQEGIRIIDVNVVYVNSEGNIATYNRMLDIWQLLADQLN